MYKPVIVSLLGSEHINIKVDWNSSEMTSTCHITLVAPRTVIYQVELFGDLAAVEDAKRDEEMRLGMEPVCALRVLAMAADMRIPTEQLATCSNAEIAALLKVRLVAAFCKAMLL